MYFHCLLALWQVLLLVGIGCILGVLLVLLWAWCIVRSAKRESREAWRKAGESVSKTKK